MEGTKNEFNKIDTCDYQHVSPPIISIEVPKITFRKFKFFKGEGGVGVTGYVTGGINTKKLKI